MLWTSEAVSRGHPDKVADQIADGLLDAYLAVDPKARVAVEVTVLKDFVLLSGEASAAAKPGDVPAVVRAVLADVGYDRESHGMVASTCEVANRINEQSPQIAAAVVRADGEIGAGDQGMMFGYATDETANYMPLAHQLAFEAIRLLERDIKRQRDAEKWGSPLRPDAKTQVTLLYENGKPVRADTVVVSTCHAPGMTPGDVRGYVDHVVIRRMEEGEFGKYFSADTKWLVNPAGEWTLGGPAADTGLSGRKIVVDQYGSDCPIGGGSFSGKDPTKVDRSAAYAARHVAKNLVAAGLATRATVQLSYAIGVSQPVAVQVLACGSTHPNDALSAAVRECVDLSPKGIIERLGLRKPIYYDTAAGGHFGRDGFPWEKLDLVPTLKDRLKVQP